MSDLKSFWWMAYDAGNCDLMPNPREVMAKDLGHALQRVAASLPDDAADVRIWENKVNLTRRRS